MLKDTDKIYLFSVLSSILKGDAIPYLLDDIDYGVLFETAAEQGVLNMLCSALSNIYIPEDIEGKFKLNKAKQLELIKEFDMLLELFNKNNYKCMPLDGWAIRGLYPEPFYRESNDCDLLIDQDDRENIKYMLEKNGYTCVRECQYSDYYFKPPHTKIVLKTENYAYNGRVPLWSRAVLLSGTSCIFTLSPEDRYVCALIKLRQRLDKGQGGVKILTDLFVLIYAYDHVFNREYLTESIDQLGLGFFEVMVKDSYKELFLATKEADPENEILVTIFNNRPDILPPKYISPEKKKFIKKVKTILFSTGAAFTVISILILILIFNNNFSSPPDNESDPGNVNDGTENIGGSDEYSQEEQKPVAFNDGIYTGPLKEGLPDGHGKMEYYSGDVYEGDFKAGKRDGKGTYTFAVGGYYTGEHTDNIIQGEGVMEYPNGDLVSGVFADGLPNGICEYTYENGNIYIGDFVDGVRDGTGIFTMTNGDVYDGEFKNGQRNGSGTYTYSNGDVYTGSWSEGQPHGQGTFKDENGTYIGDFVNGIKEGTGKLTFTNGNIYEGKFKNGYANDTSGKLTYSTGDICTAPFVNGVASGNGRLTYKNGDIAEGTFSNGTLNGKARYYVKQYDLWIDVVYKNGEIETSG